jgi:ribonucleoside-diphosphate reductase beta chain
MSRDIFTLRTTLAPYEYPEMLEFIKPIQSTYWVHDEINFDKDVQDFKINLSSDERHLIGTILKTFAMTEVFVADEFWGKIGEYLPKPEVQIVAASFTENEWRHALAYKRLNEVLGLDDFEAFLEDEVAMAKFANLTKIGKDHEGNPSRSDVAKTLAIFGAFTENVCLFAQFATLRSFSTNGRNLLTNVGDIIDWSQFDEFQHARVAMWLFNKIIQENPEIWTDEFKSDIYTAAKITFDLERDLIDQMFERGDLPNLKKRDLVNYMKYRINLSLETIKLKPIFNVDADRLSELEWFEVKFKVDSHKDFFARRVTDYTKNLVEFNADTVFVDASSIKERVK